MAAPTISPLGDDALLLRWGDGIDAAMNARVHAFAARLRAAAPAWLVDVVPAYASAAVFFDGACDAVQIAQTLRSLASAPGETAQATPPRLVELPVCYGGEHGPDLADVASHCGRSPDEVIARHTAVDYTVAMLGFSPGFPYLLGLDPALATPRLATPRTRVPAGSVGIGGAQTGVYPDAGPGGWQLIGRTPRRLFDATRAAPSMLLPGDRLRFVAIGARRFDVLEREAP